METKVRPTDKEYRNSFSSRGLSTNGVAPAMETEQRYVLPGGVAGTMKQLLEDPSTTTRSIRSSQAVLHALYRETNVDETSRNGIENRATRTRMGLVLDIFRPKSREGMTSSQIREEGEKNAARMIQTAAVIYDRGNASLGEIK